MSPTAEQEGEDATQHQELEIIGIEPEGAEARKRPDYEGTTNDNGHAGYRESNRPIHDCRLSAKGAKSRWPRLERARGFFKPSALADEHSPRHLRSYDFRHNPRDSLLAGHIPRRALNLAGGVALVKDRSERK
jgi:hypothetical protein